MTDNPYLRLLSSSSQSNPSHYPLHYSYPWKPGLYPLTHQPYDASHSHSASATVPKPPSPSPSPPPSSPSTYKYWDEVLLSFFRKMRLTQAVAGLEADMLVLNAEWEQATIPQALIELIGNLSQLGASQVEEDYAMADDSHTEKNQETSLDERKLAYVHLSDGSQPKTPTSMTKEISHFLAKNRARNDASNRDEFLRSLAEKRRRLEDQRERDDEERDHKALAELPPSCARADAKMIDRDAQMKYDIARNEDGPLKRTIVAASLGRDVKGKAKANTDGGVNGGSPSSYLVTENALDERLQNIETHFAVQYVPSPPSTLLDRLKCLEEHIIRLETDYPPWAALHFNQPNRGWPPPPRLTPIIVPPQMRLSGSGSIAKDVPAQDISSGNERTARNGGATKTKTKIRSSLHRAVMEKLEVKQAMQDLGRS